MKTAKEIERAQHNYLKRSRKYELCKVVSFQLFGAGFHKDERRFLPMRALYKRLDDAGYKWNGELWVPIANEEGDAA